MSSPLNPADRDIPKRAEGAVHRSKGDAQKCAVFVKPPGATSPLTFDSRVFRIHSCTDAVNPCPSGHPASPRKKNRSVRGLLCRLVKAGAWRQEHRAEKAQLETDGGIGPNRNSHKEGGRAAELGYENNHLHEYCGVTRQLRVTSKQQYGKI